jgi:hypothetical protein
MSDDGPAGIVGGFSDLAAGLGGLAWQLGGSGGLLRRNDEVQEAHVGFSREGEGMRLEMRAEGAEVEATLAPSVGMSTTAMRRPRPGCSIVREGSALSTRPCSRPSTGMTGLRPGSGSSCGPRERTRT